MYFSSNESQPLSTLCGVGGWGALCWGVPPTTHYMRGPGHDTGGQFLGQTFRLCVQPTMWPEGLMGQAEALTDPRWCLVV